MRAQSFCVRKLFRPSLASLKEGFFREGPQQLFLTRFPKQIISVEFVTAIRS